MNRTDVLVIGGSVGGVSAAITARRHYPGSSITVVRQAEKSVVPCGIPYMIGTLDDPEKNVIPDSHLKDHRIDLIVDEVVAIDRVTRSISLAGADDPIGYERLVLATGSRPIIPPIPGVELENVFPIGKDLSYLTHILETLKTAEEIVIVGGGFIGLEVADECASLDGKRITVVEVLPHCLYSVFDESTSIQVEDALRQKGIRIECNEQLMAITGEGKVEGVELRNGGKLKADVVILGIGVRPNVDLAEGAGLGIGPTGCVDVNRRMLTGDPYIFAIGDCAEKKGFFSGSPSRAWLASAACMEGRVAGANLFEARRAHRGTISAFSTRIAGVACGVVGIGETGARTAGIPYVTGEAESMDMHPGTLPGAELIRLKLVFDSHSMELIGGEMVGGDSVGSMVNLVTTLVQTGMTADRIATLQYGTHPLLTPSPMVYPPVVAAENALMKIRG